MCYGAYWRSSANVDLSVEAGVAEKSKQVVPIKNKDFLRLNLLTFVYEALTNALYMVVNCRLLC